MAYGCVACNRRQHGLYWYISAEEVKETAQVNDIGKATLD